MNGDFIPQYLNLLKRLESIGDISKEAVFKVLKIDNKEKLEQLMKMDDNELIKALS